MNNILPEYILVVGALLFSAGIIGIFLKRNMIVLFLCIELMLNSANLTFIAFSKMNNMVDGHIIVFFSIVLAAAEAVVGLALIIAVERTRKTVNVDSIKLMEN